MNSETATQTGADADVIHAIHQPLIDADLLTQRPLAHRLS
jgi:hypothetical protein